MSELRYRQVHLDFHTSEHIPDIGAGFDAEEFAATLEKARVNSVTCFARCHHGYIYFDTKVHPERRHPHLTQNLLKEQIEACHARNIRVPVYITVQWDHFTANQHPEWLCLTKDGAWLGTPPYQPGFYRRLCLNSPYIDFLKDHVKEVLETLPTDGIFFDIVGMQDCSCAYCRFSMEAEGLDPSSDEARKRYALKVLFSFKMDMTRFVRQFNKACTIFYNAGHIGPRLRPVAHAFTHFELESLPSGGWGYMHFPLTMRYARNLGIDCLGMTGKFHTSWGDFHSFKNEAALQFECFQMLALNAKCSIGDQLHPSGKICPTTYKLIGSVYSEVEKKEPWCSGAKAVTDIGVLTPEEFGDGSSRISLSAMGVVRILQEGAQQFEILDSHSDFAPFKVIILPDDIPVSKSLAVKIERYLAAGGALLASYRSGLNREKTAFTLKALGVKLKGEAPFSPDFVCPAGKIGAGLPRTEHVMYMKGMEVQTLKGAKVLAAAAVPYFNRTFKRFCSHRHTPSSGAAGYPAIVGKGKAIYFAHPIFTQYAKNAPRWCKRLVLNALDLLLPRPLLRVGGPSTVLTAINEQAAQRRWVLHLLHYIPERRGQDFDVLEDIIPLHNVEVSVRVPKRPKGVICVPEETPLRFRLKAGRAEFVVPEIRGHRMVALAFA